MKRRSLTLSLAGLPLAARAQPAWSPDRPLRLVVGFAPGGSTDTTARIVAQAITAGLGQSVLVENRTGAAGNLANEQVARSAPDGHTLVMGSMGTHATNAALYRNLAFDVVRDFVPVSLVALSACLLVVRSALPAASVHDWSPAPAPSPAG
jgi:tripartite-type tricarboxylate transporter receptor subunit TctC